MQSLLHKLCCNTSSLTLCFNWITSQTYSFRKFDITTAGESIYPSDQRQDAHKDAPSTLPTYKGFLQSLAFDDQGELLLLPTSLFARPGCLRQAMVQC